MRITLLTAIALATLTAGASAQTPAVQPVTEFPPVSVEIAISDAAGTVTETLSCEWTEPREDDRQCLRFRWDAEGARFARRDVKAAASKLRHKR